MATNAERQERFRERQKAIGLVQYTVTVPRAALAYYKDMAAFNIQPENRDLYPSRFTDPKTGRLVSFRSARPEAPLKVTV